MLTSPFLSPEQKERCVEATKRVLIELKVIATQAYRRLIEEVGLPVPNFQNNYGSPLVPQEYGSRAPGGFGPGQSPNVNDLAPLMSNVHMHGVGTASGSFAAPVPYHAQRSQNFPPELIEQASRGRGAGSFSPAMDPFNPFGLRSPELSPITRHAPLENYPPGSLSPPPPHSSAPYPNQAHSLAQAGNLLGMSQPTYPMPPVLPPHVYQAYYQMYQQQNPQNIGGFQ
jgi:protein JSN1